MHRSNNQFFKQAVFSFWLIACLQTQADSSLNLSINKHQDTFETAAMKIWDWAEVGYQEFKSSELLKEELKANGFTIQSGVAEIPTAFIAEYSNGRCLSCVATSAAEDVGDGLERCEYGLEENKRKHSAV